MEKKRRRASQGETFRDEETQRDEPLSEDVVEISRLEGYVPILQGLITYHKRMTFACGSDCSHYESSIGNIDECKDKCPKAGLYDIYLEALEESLRLINDRISALKSR